MFAITAVLLMFGAAFAITSNDEVTEEDDAFLPLVLVIIAVAAVGVVGGWELAQLTDKTGDQNFLRTEDAKLIAEGMTRGLDAYANAMKNYENIWKLTKEHWERQSELAASAIWTKNAQKDLEKVLYASGTYENTVTMQINSTDQFNKHLKQIDDHIKKWNNDSTYANGNMEIQITYGDRTISFDSDDSFNLEFGTYAYATANGNKVAYNGGGIYADRNSTVVYKQLEENNTWSSSFYTIPAGSTIREDSTPNDSVTQILTLESNTHYFGNFIPTVTTDQAKVLPAIKITKNDEVTILYGDQYEWFSPTEYSTKITDGNGMSSTNKLTFAVVPVAGGDRPADINLMPLFLEYSNLLHTMVLKMEDARNSASAVWDIFTSAGEASAYVTTLVAPNNYANMTLSDSQKEILTILAMQQLAEYYDGNTFDENNIKMTMNSMQLFCRGNVIIPDSDGNPMTIYDDVIFTPMFYKNTNLHTGDNQISNYGFIAVWADGQSLATFDTTNLGDAGLYYAQNDATLQITEMYYNGAPAESIQLFSQKVEFIEGHSDPLPDPIESTADINNLAKIVMTILILIGGALIVLGIMRGNPIFFIPGIILVIVGFLFSQQIAEFIDSLMKGYDFFKSLPF